MYNHYIPQSDGSYRRNYVPENNRRQQQRSGSPPSPQPSPSPLAHREDPKPEQKPEPPHKEEHQEPHKEDRQEPRCESRQEQSPLSFLRKLLPKDLDSTDMIIIALLLLLSGEDEDADLAPLLTIALYFLL